jgi:DNA-binding CsgD family transcriptional regulator
MTPIRLASMTVRFHLDNVARKLGASNRAHAVAIAVQPGLLGPIGA